MKNETLKTIKRRLSWCVIRVLISICTLIPLSFNYFLGKILGGLAYLMVRRHRKVALESLQIAFPQESLEERKKIAYDFFVTMTQAAFELLYTLKHQGSLCNTRIEGKQYLDQALAKKKGVMLVTAHLGNFPLMSLKLSKEDYPINLVVRPMRDTHANKYFSFLREKAGIKTIFSLPRRQCVVKIIQALRNNEIVVMLMDQNFGTGGVWVKFFGKLAATPIGPIVLALRTNAAIIPAYIYRKENYKHTIRILPEEKIAITEDKDETILLAAIKFTRMIEGWIRTIVHQWGWMHRRWKSRPSEAVKKERFRVEQ